MALVGIPEDGSPMDVVTISNQLQGKAGTFVDINQVRDLCEGLVQEGKLERVGEGGSFAEYRLRAISVSQPASA